MRMMIANKSTCAHACAQPHAASGRRVHYPASTLQPLVKQNVHISPPTARFQEATSERINKRRSTLDTRKRYLTHFWYAAGFTKNVLPGKLYSTRLLDMDIVLWRAQDSQKVFCVTDECPISRGALSATAQFASAVGSRHGKQTLTVGGVTYDAETGSVLDAVPSQEGPVCLEVWDCDEQGGFVWLFFGDRRMPAHLRPPIPSVPELALPGWHGVHGEVTIKANHWTVVENIIDMAHVPYVHGGTVGNHAAFVDINIERKPMSLDFSFPIQNHTKEGQKAAFQVDTLATMCLPQTSFIRFTFPFNLRLVTINSVVPIDEERTTIRFCQMRNFLPTSLFDPVILKGMENILGEDKVILEQLRPEEVLTEVSLKADAPQLALRSMRGRYIDAGCSMRPGAHALHSMPSWREVFVPPEEAAAPPPVAM